MMKFTSSLNFVLALVLTPSHLCLSSASSCDASDSAIVCKPVTAVPTLDGDLSDWADVDGVTLPLTGAMGALPYASGDTTIKCSYDETHVYFAFEVPGPYRFSTSDDHLCASISTMWKIGENAQYSNMGGCPHVSYGGTKCAAVPELCEPFRVDLGAHWELKTTEMGVAYGVDLESGSGNDPIANKDDEWAVSPYCRPDDDDALAANEWAGAWIHTKPTDDNVTSTFDSSLEDQGSYIFEMSRLLQTASTLSDIQLEAGETYSFGFAYWDPFEEEETGWTKAGHYVTGCSRDWIPLTLSTGEEEEEEEEKTESGGFVMNGLHAMTAVSFVATISSFLF